MVSIHRPGSPLPSLPRVSTPGTPPGPVAGNTPSTESRTKSQERSTFEPATTRAARTDGTSKAQDNDPADDTVVVIDFKKNPLTARGDHGDEVAYVVANSGNIPASQVRNVGIDIDDDVFGDPDARIDLLTTSFLDNASTELESLAKTPGKVQAVNMSMGLSKLSLVKGLLPSREDPVTKQPLPEESQANALRGLAEELKLDVKSLDAKPLEERRMVVAQALLDRVEQRMKDSKPIQAAKARYDKATEQLDKKGIFVVLSAGNEGDTLKAMKDLKLRFNDEVEHSLLFNKRDNVLVIGASDDAKGIASFSTPSKYVFAAMDGTDVKVNADGTTQSGTSYSAPQVAALVAELRGKGLSPKQVRSVLQEAAKDTRASRKEEGAGIIDPARVRQLAAQQARKNEANRPRSAMELKLPVVVRP
ncbi:S8 family serine peptidase [Pyxidicoccus sp. 3LFB2]